MITMIVLLILAMVSISLVINRGIIDKVQNATVDYKDAEEKEQIVLGYQRYQMSKYTNQGSNLTVQGATSVNGNEASGWNITFPSGNQYQLAPDGTILGSVTNPHAEEEEWEYAYTCTDGIWSDIITKGNTAEGDIVAKFYKQNTLIKPSNYVQENFYFNGNTMNIDIPFPQNNSYHLVIEGTGPMGPLMLGNEITDVVAWHTTLLSYFMQYMQEGSIPDNVVPIMPYVTNIYICDGITNIGSDSFSYGFSLTNLNISNTVTNIGRSAFYNCRSLSYVSIPNSVISIGISEFEDCTSLSSVNIGNSLTSIDSSAFQGCTSLKDINIPNSVTSIGGYAFESCTSLEKITIPNSVTSMEENIFTYWTSEQTINIRAASKPEGWDYDWDGYCNAVINWNYQGE